jgi:phosphoribosylformimino-5-aminoimidazole carboxamide ribonucleotide (ProFAR) isomerase
MRFIEPRTPQGFELIPSLAVMGSTPVWVKEGKYNPIRIDGASVSVEKLVKELTEEFGVLHYLDILGIRKGVVEWDLFRSAVEKGGNLWADMGVLYSEGLIDVIMAGAEMAVVTTKMIESLEEIVSSFELTENLALQIDYDHNILSKDKQIRNMSPGELVSEMASFGMETFILDDISEGRERIDVKFLLDVIKHLPPRGKVYVGIEDLSEIKELSGTEVKGAIISCSKLIGGVE